MQLLAGYSFQNLRVITEKDLSSMSEELGGRKIVKEKKVE